MPRLSMWRNEAKTNDFKFFDRRIHEMYTIGGTGINVYKYVGIKGTEGSTDATQPTTADDPFAIQDFLFLENRDRKYDTDVYNLRGIYNVADTDFDLSQFGLFLQNDTVFITFHLNDMITALGRKLQSGDVLELPHLRDYDGLDTSLDASLSRYYVVQEGTRPTEGFSPTWFPHLWRVKCKQLVDSQEYSDILDRIQVDINTGESKDTTLRDLLSTYQKELEINNAVVEQAEADVPESGYDTSKYYVVPLADDGRPAEAAGLTADTVNFTADNITVDASFEAVTPKANGYEGHLVGDGLAPNGFPVTMGTSFPASPSEGDFVLRLDFMPNRLFRFNGARWIKIEDDLRTPLGGKGQRLIDTFVNNTAQSDIGTTTVNSRQALSSILEAQADE